jgi:hypothetical protein
MGSMAVGWLLERVLCYDGATQVVLQLKDAAPMMLPSVIMDSNVPPVVKAHTVPAAKLVSDSCDTPSQFSRSSLQTLTLPPLPAPTPLPPQEELDPFRRGPQRQACASANAAVWLPANDTAPASLLQELRQRTGGKDLLAIIREAAGRVA